MNRWQIYEHLKVHDGQCSLSEMARLADCNLHELVEGIVEFTLMVASNPGFNHYENIDKGEDNHEFK